MSNSSFSIRHIEHLLVANKISLFLLSLPILLLYIFSPMIFQYDTNGINSKSSTIVRNKNNDETRETRLDPIVSEHRWCMLTKDDAQNADATKWFSTLEHFPHSLEWYASCWTWLQEETQFAGPEVQGGFLIDESLHKKLQVKYWNRAFLPAMEFPIWVHNSTDANAKQLPPDNMIFRTVYSSGWFRRKSTCDSFRRRLWENLDVKPVEVSRKKRRIGILNRNESRTILNIPSLIREISVHFHDKDLDIDVRSFDSEYELKGPQDTLQAQAQWFASKDLIILAHGAALANVIFMRPGAAVLEMFPRSYYNSMFWDLMDQCDIYHEWYYDGKNPKKKYSQKQAQKETEDEWENRFVNKKKDISFKWKQVDHLIRRLLQKVDSND